jgi:phosphoribosylaminoimidazole carboxylase (NCAIR synthetase)
VSCVDGDQRGRMMAMEAPRHNISMSFLDAGGLSCPAADTVPSNRITQGSLKDADKIKVCAMVSSTVASLVVSGSLTSYSRD